MQTRTERTMWHCWPPMELISLSLFVPGDGIPPRGGRSERIRWRRAKVGNFAAANGIDFSPAASSFQESYSIRLTRNIGCSTRYRDQGWFVSQGWAIWSLISKGFVSKEGTPIPTGYNCKRHRISLLFLVVPRYNFSLVIVGEKQSTRIGW